MKIRYEDLMSVSMKPKTMIEETLNSWVSQKVPQNCAVPTLTYDVSLKMSLFLTRKWSSTAVGAALVGGDDPQSFGSAAWWRPSATPYRPL